MMATRWIPGRTRLMGGSSIYATPQKFARNRPLRSPEIGLAPLRDELKSRHGVGKPRRAESRAGVELVAVPGAFEVAVTHHAFSERTVLVRADIGDGPELAVLADDGDA